MYVTSYGKASLLKVLAPSLQYNSIPPTPTDNT